MIDFCTKISCESDTVIINYSTIIDSKVMSYGFQTAITNSMIIFNKYF